MFRSNRYASVAATLALLLSLAGSATATTIALISGDDVKDGSLSGADLADHSIGGKKLKKHSVGARHLRVGSVTTRQVRDGTLTSGDLSNDAIAALKGAKGEPGPAGPQGQPGPAGNSIKLAGYVKTNPQTLPGDPQFHTVWSIDFSSEANEGFIVTGGPIGGANANCQVDEQVTIDGSPAPSVFNGAGLLTFPPGAHTISYEVRASCPISVPNQEVYLIPFMLP
jgi:hypothetical protein